MSGAQGAGGPALGPDDPAEPVSVRMLSAFNRLRAGLPDPERVGTELEGLGFAITPSPTGDGMRRAILGVSRDGMLGALGTLDLGARRMSVAVSARPGAELRDGELYHMLTRVYGFDGHETPEPHAEIAEGYQWPCVFSGLAQVIRLLRLADGSWRIEALTDARLQETLAGGRAGGGAGAGQQHDSQQDG